MIVGHYDHLDPKALTHDNRICFFTQEIKLDQAGMVNMTDTWTMIIVRWKDFTWALAREMSPYDILQVLF